MENYDFGYDFMPNTPEDEEIIDVVEPEIEEVEPEIEEIIEPEIEEVIEEPIPTFVEKDGQVYDCFKLNVRELPTVTKDNSGILSVLSKGDIVKILDDSSVEGWVFISTKNGIKGYCMSDYIKVIN